MKALLGIFLSVAIVTSMVGCATDSPERLPEATGPLLTVEWRGGLCQYGGCTTTLEVGRDGAYRIVEGDGSSMSGQLEPGLIGALEEAVASADFDAARTAGFTEVCPTAYDGQEIIYTFHTVGGDERLSTCEYVIEWDVPPFPQALAILETVGR